MGLAPIMTSVMGEQGKGRAATAEEQQKMGALLSEALDAGGWGCSALMLGADSVQRDYDGTPMITDIMAPDDLLFFAKVLREKGRGFVQVLGSDFDLFEKVAEVSGRPLIWNTLEFAADQHGKPMVTGKICSNGWKVVMNVVIVFSAMLLLATLRLNSPLRTGISMMGTPIGGQ